MALITVSKPCASVSTEFESPHPVQSIGLERMPVEIFARLSPLLTTKENVQLLMVSTSIWGHKDTIEQTYRLELKGRIGLIFSTLTSSFTTDVLTIKNEIMQAIDGMTFKTSQVVKEKCGSDLDRLVPLLISEYNGLPADDSTREQKGLTLTNFVASRPNVAMIAFQNSDVRKLLRSYFSTSNGIPLVHLDKLLVQQINLLAGNGRARETETMLALIERGSLRDALRAKIIALLIKQKDFVTATKFFNSSLFTPDSWNEVVEAFVSSCTVEEICIFARGIQYRNNFRKEIFVKLIAAERLEEAKKLIEETPDGTIKTYMQKVMIQKNCEALAKQGLVDEVLELIPLHDQNQTKTLKWVALIFAFDNHFGPLIRVLNLIPADLVYIKNVVVHIHRDCLLQAQTFAKDISDQTMRQLYESEINAVLALLPPRASPS